MLNQIMRRIRLLPALIFFGALLLTLKLGNIMHGMAEMQAEMSIQTAQAQAQDAGQNAAQEPPAQEPQQEASRPDPAMQAPELVPSDIPGDATPLPTTDDQPILRDPERLTRSEIRLLQELGQRRRELDNRERELNQRETLLKAAEQKLVSQQGELEEIRTEIKGLLRQVDEEEKDRLANLVRIYEGMKPRDAATIFNELEMPVLLGVVERMNPRRLSPVVAAMSPDRARLLTRELAERQDVPALPQPQ